LAPRSWRSVRSNPRVARRVRDQAGRPRARAGFFRGPRSGRGERSGKSSWVLCWSIPSRRRLWSSRLSAWSLPVEGGGHASRGAAQLSQWRAGSERGERRGGPPGGLRDLPGPAKRALPVKELATPAPAAVRAGGAGNGPEVVQYGDLVINLETHHGSSRAPLNLTYRSTSPHLLRAPTRRGSSPRDPPLPVWSYEYDGGLRTIDVYVRRLRATRPQHAGWIQTIRSVGYAHQVTLTAHPSETPEWERFFATDTGVEGMRRAGFVTTA